MFDNVQPVTISQRAAAEIKKIMETKNIPKDYGLRVGVKGGGCAGMTYVLGFDQKEADDTEYEINGITVIMKSAHGIYLHGIEVDFQQGLNARGFVFNNPNASSTCGCGTSFAV